MTIATELAKRIRAFVPPDLAKILGDDAGIISRH
jgi:hypothetical protein